MGLSYHQTHIEKSIVLEFQELVVINGWLATGMFFATLALPTSALICSAFLFTKENLLKKVAYLIAAIVFAFLAVMMFLVMHDYVDGTAARNGEKFAHNVKVKYDVSEVISFNSVKNLAHANNLADAEEAELEVKIMDGTRFRFLVTVDPETSEPTLIDPPVNGGSTVTKNLGADELLKIK